MKWTKRVLMGAGLTVASLAVVPAVAGAASSDAGCYTSCTPPTVVATTVPPNDGGTPPSVSATTTSATASSSSLPFTGADVEELAVVGLGAVLAGGLLMRRRRSGDAA